MASPPTPHKNPGSICPGAWDNSRVLCTLRVIFQVVHVCRGPTVIQDRGGPAKQTQGGYPLCNGQRSVTKVQDQAHMPQERSTGVQGTPWSEPAPWAQSTIGAKEGTYPPHPGKGSKHHHAQCKCKVHCSYAKGLFSMDR